ncbi:2'-5' RNA ligase [Salinivibrio kushneri]|uniref:RNA 2',3'-cyclic phosphodiesterase n=1 Tax=Salinivibrio kushneri TaxID=1908198 RepID=A0AB36JXB5_9GAMM|nr:RNA 2',3'-cyclic phosphodiesterase [Salinivibrio kushneri]OOE40377.1 2'-5' RNA ligase [Salinivibrio kushneri]QCP01343.1 RNA 2',3'-cyclic phosphodiesterase [Salinivibrio kushneri]
MRLFFALGLDEKTNQAAREQLVRYHHHLCGEGRAVPDQNLHLTLAFLGEVPDTKLSALQAAASNLALPAFSLTTSGVEVWDQPKIACVTFNQPPPVLFDLAHHLQSLPVWHAKADSHAFTPHITLRRGVKDQQALHLPPLPTQTFACQRFGLYASPSSASDESIPRDNEGRALYQCLHQFSLC